MLPTSTYPMSYNVIPPFVPLNPNLYRANLIITKGFDFSIFENYTGYVPRNVYPVPKHLLYHQHIYHILLAINFLQWFN
jgi:hypothetical protein